MKTVTGHLDGQISPLVFGSFAPDFTLPSTQHAPLSLRSLTGYPVVLTFYPFDWEPVSREQLTLYHEFAGEFDCFNARLLGISADHLYSHDAFAQDAQISFPLLSDFCPRGATARRYGVYREWLGVCARALFVLDGQGIIRFSAVYPDQLNPGVGDVLSTLEVMT